MSTFTANDNKTNIKTGYATNTHDPNIPSSSTYDSNDIMAKLNELTKTKDNDNNKKSDTIKFWSDDPNILFQKDQIFEFYPVNTMTYSQKLNAISRTIILITTITFILTQSLRILVIAAITLGSIFLLYYYQGKNNKRQDNTKPIEKSDSTINTKEGFDDAGIAYLKQNSIPLPEQAFSKPTVNNPFSNVLLPDYDYNPNKKPAPPAYSTDVNNDILSNAKKLVIDSNPDQPDIADKLFKDLGDNFNFEQSLRPFNSNPSTTIPNDQAAFADFCYGSMVSCKEGNLFACARNLSRHIN